MEEWIDSVKEAISLLSDTEKEFLKNCGLLTIDAASLISAIRNGTPICGNNAMSMTNHVKAFFKLVWTIKNQREKHIGELMRRVLNGTNLVFDGIEEVRQVYVDQDMLDAYREVMTGQL